MCLLEVTLVFANVSFRSLLKQCGTSHLSALHHPIHSDKCEIKPPASSLPVLLVQLRDTAGIWVIFPR